MSNQTSAGYKFALVVSILAFIISLVLVNSTTIKTYPTNEYWVAKNYKHVYHQFSGEIVDSIEENETCTIEGDEIVVREQNFDDGTITFGYVLLFASGSVLAFLIYYGYLKKTRIF